MTEIPALIAAFTTLFIIIDPPGLAPVFIALTQGMGAAQRRAIAVRACLVAAALMMVFLLLGEAVLGFIGISMDAFRIAGGILLFLTALDMLFQRRQTRREDNAAEGQAERVEPRVDEERVRVGGRRIAGAHLERVDGAVLERQRPVPAATGRACAAP